MGPICYQPPWPDDDKWPAVDPGIDPVRVLEAVTALAPTMSFDEKMGWFEYLNRMVEEAARRSVPEVPAKQPATISRERMGSLERYDDGRETREIGISKTMIKMWRENEHARFERDALATLNSWVETTRPKKAWP